MGEHSLYVNCRPCADDPNENEWVGLIEVRPHGMAYFHRNEALAAAHQVYNELARLRAEVAELRSAQQPRPMSEAPRDGMQGTELDESEWLFVPLPPPPTEGT